MDIWRKKINYKNRGKLTHFDQLSSFIFYILYFILECLFLIIRYGIHPKSNPNTGEGYDFIGIEAFTEIENGKE